MAPRLHQVAREVLLVGFEGAAPDLNLNVVGKFEDAYNYLKRAQQNDLEIIKKEYTLFVEKTCYGKYIKDELAVSCYWLGKYKEGLDLINTIIDDPDFDKHKQRLTDNIGHFNIKLND